MDELDLFRSFRRGVDSASADARERAARRLAEVIEGARAPGTRQRHNTRRTAALALAILVVGVGAAAAFGTVRDLLSDSNGRAGYPAWSPNGLSIAYVVWSGPDAPNELSVMNTDGSAQRTVARDRWLIRSPVWSPDSRRIAFLTNPCSAVAVARGCARRTTISVINADGSGRRKLVRGAGPGSGYGFAWSPNGRRAAFVSNRDGVTDLYVINADGSGQRRLTRSRTIEVNPVWSPDGRQIAFVSTIVADPKGSLRSPEIHVVEIDGSGQRQLARGDSPSWSPNGRKIVFVHESPYLEREIYLMNADGSEQRRLARGAADEDTPQWSPDGRKIAFARIVLPSLDHEINVINADGSRQKPLARHVAPAANLAGPVWSPNGRRIAFVSEGAVYVINADGSERRKLTHLQGN